MGVLLRLAVIQIKGATRYWWESSEQDLNLIRWRDFCSNIMVHFAGPFFYKERTTDLMYAQGHGF